MLTDAAPVRGTMAVRDGKGDLTLSLPSAPRSIEWNMGNWILAITDFPRSTAMLDYQLAHSDVTSRSEAIKLLELRRDDEAAIEAIARDAENDRFWAVRAQSLQALTLFSTDSMARAAVYGASRDSDSRIRQAAAGALAAFPGAETDAILSTIARSDSSLIVRGVAVASYLKVAGDAGLPLAREMMAEQSWRNVLRTPAVTVLKGMHSAAAQSLYHEYAK